MVRAVQKKTLNVGGFAEPSKEAASKAVEAKRIAAKYPRKSSLDRMNDALDKMNKDLGPGFPKPAGSDPDDPFKFNRGAFFSPKDDGKSVVKSDINTSVFAGAESGTNFAVANDANKAVGITNQATTNLADASYDTTYKQEKGYAEDSYEKIKQILDKPKKTVGELISEPAFKEATDRDRFGSEAYKDTIRLKEARRDSAYDNLSDAEAIDTFKRKNIRYGTDPDGTPTAKDYFFDKVEYDTKTLKKYIATDAKENYERREKAAKEASERRINKLMSDTAYKETYKKYDEPSILQKASNFLRGTDLKGEEDVMNKYILSKDERLKRLREADREYRVPGITVSPYGFVDVPADKLKVKAGQFSEGDASETENKTSNQMSTEDFNKKYDKEYTKLKRMSEGKTPNPSLLERTTKFLGDVVGGVSKIFTPGAQAGDMPSTDSLANTFTSGQSLGVSDASSFGGLSGLPSSMGDNISAGISGMEGNIAAGMRNFGRNIDSGISRTFGSRSGSFATSRDTGGISQGLANRAAKNPNVTIRNGRFAATNNSAKARAQASAYNRQRTKTSVSAANAANQKSMRDRARARHKAFKANRKKKKKSKK